MDIHRTNWPAKLRDILDDISKAHFVAIDFEFSGIAQNSQREASSNGGQQTLEQRYQEVREAAGKYQILQVGITVAVEDVTHGGYELKPYNIPLNPLITERGLKIERDLTLQSGAVSFLLGNTFDISAPFKLGVPYLSRAEEAIARERMVAALDKSTIADIVVDPNDTATVRFVDNVRHTLEAFRKECSKQGDKAHSGSRKSKSSGRPPEQVVINPMGSSYADGLDLDDVQGLSGFQRRLIYQTVRKEYAELVAVSRGDLLIIKIADPQHEARLAQNRRVNVEEKIARQIGLRWLFEAMTGGSLAQIDPRSFAVDEEGNPKFVNYPILFMEIHNLREALKNHRPVLVGHNLFTDLMYLYSSFFGPLPRTLFEFNTVIRNLFPLIIDTKYLATSAESELDGSRSGAHKISSLQETALRLSRESAPKIWLHSAMQRYNSENDAAWHEAGYDAYLTAQLCIRLSTKLERERKARVAILGQKLNGASSNGRQMFKVSNDDKRAIVRTQNSFAVLEADVSSQEEQATEDYSSDSDGGIDITLFGKDSSVNTRQPAQNREDAHQVDASFSPIVQSEVNGEVLGSGEVEQEIRVEVKELRAMGLIEKLELMPGFGSQFWSKYGNKLRVYGTQEEVLHLKG